MEWYGGKRDNKLKIVNITFRKMDTTYKNATTKITEVSV